MCFHTTRDVEEYKRHVKREMTKKGIPQVAMAVVRDKHKRFIGAMPVDWDNMQAIANTFRDLQHWHPEAVQLDFSEINKVRGLAYTKTSWAGMVNLSRDHLPYPSGGPEPYAFAKPEETWDDQLKEAAAYIHKNLQKAGAAA